MESIQSLLVTIFSFVAALSVVVFVHEFGHFQVARWLKVAIDTFSIGFGKTLAGWRDKHGVVWKIGALPLGGYVKFTGDADAVSSHSEESLDDPEVKAEARRKGLFHAQPVLTRALVVVAGPMTNFAFSIFAFAVLAWMFGVDRTDYTMVRAYFSEVTAGSAAEEAGLRAGEAVEAVNGTPVRGLQSFVDLVATSPGKALELTLVDAEGGMRTVAVTPRAAPNAPNHGVLGVKVGINPSDRQLVKFGPLEALGQGANQTWRIITDTVHYIGGIFAGTQSAAQIAGPLGIATQAGEIAKASLEPPDVNIGDKLINLAFNLFNFAAYLSVAVGFVNLLPIPILDGGHLVFYAAEALRGGKPLPPMAQEWALRAGLAVMACLFLFATWNDISRTFLGAQG